MARRRFVIGIAIALGCVHGAPHPDRAAPSFSDEITLYRDRALIVRIYDPAPAFPGPFLIASGLPPGTRDIAVLDAGGATGIELDHDMIRGTAPTAGPRRLVIAYTTERLTWSASYTLTANAAHDAARLRGELVIHNPLGVELRGRVVLVDVALPVWRDGSARRIGSALLASPPPATAAQPRDLGPRVIAAGDQRIALIDAPPRPMRRTLVYDPGSGDGLSDSYEIERDAAAQRGLPAGPVRLVEGDTQLATAQLFTDETRIASTDTIALGAAEGLIGHRERRGWANDAERKRFTEEILVTLDNLRAAPVDVVIRERLGHGPNWTLAYQSAPAVKDGAQRISLRAQVPANGQTKVLYVVVYTW